MRKYLLLCTALTISSSAYAALDCATPPTCDELGYTQTETDCAGKFTLKCPLDNTKLFCIGEDVIKCEDGGYYPALPTGYICETVTYENLSCYKNCSSSTCGTGTYSASDGIAYDSAGKAIALLYNNKYYLPKTFSCGGRTYAEAQQNIADNPQYIMPSASLISKIKKFTTTTSYWTDTTCSGHIAGDGKCYSDDTKLSCTLGLFDCTDTCPYQGTYTSCPTNYTCTKEDCSGKYYISGCNTSYYTKHKSDSEEYDCPTGANIESCFKDSNYYKCDTSNLRDFSLIVTHYTPWGSCASSISYRVQASFVDSAGNVVSSATANIHNIGYTQPQTTESFAFDNPIANGTYKVYVSGSFTSTPVDLDCRNVSYKYSSNDQYSVIVNGTGFDSIPSSGADVTIKAQNAPTVNLNLYFGNR